jgi:opacity protein-like surface antigen
VRYLSVIFFIVTGLIGEAEAADIESAYLRGSIRTTASPPVPWSWTGWYAGGQIGMAVGDAKFGDPSGPSLFGDIVSTPGFMAGGQIGYNWQVPQSHFVFGVEAAAKGLISEGTNTCLAFSGLFVSANCRVQPRMIADLTARVGWAYGKYGHSLFYIKGGPAFINSHVDIATNATPDFGLAALSTSSGFSKMGWTVGAGVEHAITPAWSMRLEYDYAGFGSQTVATPPGLVQPIPGVNAFNLTSAGFTGVSQTFQEVNLGLNYKLGVGPSAQWHSTPPTLLDKGSPNIFVAPGWELEVGARSWFSNGKFQKDLGTTTDPALANVLNSRLTYDATANSYELFSRIETPRNIFVKGNIGLGSVTGGQMNDEDWALFGGTVAYSNTLSSVTQGDIDYGTVDLGYDFFRGIGYRLGGFIGYNYYKETKDAYGCTQIANPLSDCSPAIPQSVLAITEDDTWNSLRTGLNADIMVTDHLKLGGDAAYLPYVNFNGTDDHLLRALIIGESGVGTGFQLESTLSYMITEQFSVGVGGRYWSMWTTKDAISDPSGTPCPCQTQPARTDQYGVFVQVDYTGIGTPWEGFK